VLGGVCLLGAGVLGQASMKPSLLKTMARLSESVPEHWARFVTVVPQSLTTLGQPQ
jgi:hypothetical protein